jgi:signal transduction histidine kinase
MELVPEEVPVGEYLNSVTERHLAAAEAKGITLAVELDSNLGAALWDGQRVSQALGQIVENAIKFTTKGGVVITVKRVSGRPVDDVLISVRDTGVGIAAEMLPNLFEKFTVAHDATASKYGDTGLGLALSLALAELMGGSIAAESELGKGACFTLRLPTAPPSRRKRRPRVAADPSIDGLERAA